LTQFTGREVGFGFAQEHWNVVLDRQSPGQWDMKEIEPKNLCCAIFPFSVTAGFTGRDRTTESCVIIGGNGFVPILFPKSSCVPILSSTIVE
jgi:hypothetical protein